MRHWNYLVPLAAALLLAASCGPRGQKEENTDDGTETAVQEVPASIPVADTLGAGKKVGELPEEPVFDIVTNLGTIRVKLYADTPRHRDNFAKLALSKYYDGLLFHRVIDKFMIQGGDPFTRDTSRVEEWGQGGPGYDIPAEFVPEHTHKKGALAAARRGDLANPMKESSGSQFYLVVDPSNCRHLDGEYTVFGETVAGQNVIERIARSKTDRYDMPITPVVIQRIRPNDEMNRRAFEEGQGAIKGVQAGPEVNVPEADSLASKPGTSTRVSKKGHVITKVDN